MSPKIDWTMLSKAVDYYHNRGYRYVEVPWVVSDAVHRLTCPRDEWIMRSDLGALVGSSEQSFLSLDLDGKLEKGRWLACTPCFRPDIPDDLHQQYFMKVELYVNLDPTVEKVQDVITHAMAFFTAHAPGRTEVVRTGEASWDIDIGGIEVGSYGYREAGDLKWVFGTGIAEPRFSTAMKRLR